MVSGYIKPVFVGSELPHVMVQDASKAGDEDTKEEEKSKKKDKKDKKKDKKNMDKKKKKENKEKKGMKTVKEKKESKKDELGDNGNRKRKLVELLGAEEFYDLGNSRPKEAMTLSHLIALPYLTCSSQQDPG